MPRKTTPENDLILSASGVAPRRQTAASSRTKRSAKTAEVSPSLNALASAGSEPSQEDIAALAFSYWEARGFQGGSPEEDWLRAEQHLRSLRSRTSAAIA